MSASADYGQHRDSVFSSAHRALWLLSEYFMQMQLPCFIFHSLKTSVQHGKSPWSSHFSTKTIQQLADSALPPLPTCAARVGLVLRLGRFIYCWSEGLEVCVMVICTQMHWNTYYVTVASGTLELWFFHLDFWVLVCSDELKPCYRTHFVCETNDFACRDTSVCLRRHSHLGAGNGVAWNGSDHHLKKMTSFGSGQSM